MGQGQSSNNSSSDENEPALRSDYYELLGVERTASDDDLKKAYRRKALELHPDRNYGNVEDTTRLFAEIQTAYEVLSDPQERAWYDSHRDVLLRGEQAGAGAAGGDQYSYNIRMTNTDEVLKLMLKFNGRLEFSDAPSGFYGGLRDFFKKLAKEEDIACQWENQDPMDYPDFGTKEDNYDEVVRPFYGAWTGFATKKSYAWKDQYRLSDAPDRRIRRLMEKENKKLRDEAIQEYNDAVRSLVAFVRKRDPRIQNNQKSEAERQKALREAAQAQAARSRAAHQAKFADLNNSAPAIPAWAQSNTKDELEGEFSSEAESEQHEYECVVCNKTFKSEAQFQAHEKSKKHIKTAKQLKKEMRAEGVDLDLEPERKSSSNGRRSDKPEDSEDQVGEVDYDSANENVPTEQSAIRSGETEHSDENSDSNEDDEKPNGNGHITGSRDNIQPDNSNNEESEEEDNDDYAPRSKIESRLAGDDKPGLETISSALKGTTLEGTPATSDGEADTASGTGTPRLGKAKQKRAKKAAAQAVQKDAAIDAKTTTDSGFKCAVCAADFPSKTKLFTHIKEKNHAALKTELKTPAGGKKGKKR